MRAACPSTRRKREHGHLRILGSTKVRARSQPTRAEFGQCSTCVRPVFGPFCSDLDQVSTLGRLCWFGPDSGFLRGLSAGSLGFCCVVCLRFPAESVSDKSTESPGYQTEFSVWPETCLRAPGGGNPRAWAKNNTPWSQPLLAGTRAATCGSRNATQQEYEETTCSFGNGRVAGRPASRVWYGRTLFAAPCSQEHHRQSHHGPGACTVASSGGP